jgi:hypothetical protein
MKMKGYNAFGRIVEREPIEILSGPDSFGRHTFFHNRLAPGALYKRNERGAAIEVGWIMRWHGQVFTTDLAAFKAARGLS